MPLQETMMKKAGLKKALLKAKDKKTFCAIATDKAKKEAVIVLSRKEKGKKLAAGLKQKLGAAIDESGIRFGALTVRSEAATTVSLQLVRQAPSSTLKLLVKAVKGTGFTKVEMDDGEFPEDDAEIVPDDDDDDDDVEAGDEIADDADEEDEAAPPVADAPARPAWGGAQPSAGRARSDAGPTLGQARAAPPAEPATPAAPAPAAGWTAARPSAGRVQPNATLAEQHARAKVLLERVKQVSVARADLRAPLKDAWTKVQGALTAHADAGPAIDALVQLLDGAAPAAAATPAAAAAPAAAAPPAAPAGAAAEEDGPGAALAGAGQMWRKSSDRMARTLDQLKQAILAAYADQPDIQAKLRDRLGGAALFWQADDRLAKGLAAAQGAADPAARRAAVQDSLRIAADYRAAADSDPMLRDLDNNPFGVAPNFAATVKQMMETVTNIAQKVH